MMFLLKMVNYSMSFPSLSTSFFFDKQVGGTILDHSYFLNFLAPKIIASAPVPFGPFWALFRVGTGLDWVGIGSGGIGDSGVGD